MFKNKIYKYFFKEFFRLFLIVSLAISLLVWITQAAKLLSLITELGNSINVYFIYTILSYPKVLSNTLLLSFMVTIFFLIEKFQSSNELNIYALSGVSKFKIFTRVFVVSIFLCVGYLILATFIAPHLSLKARKLLSQSKFSMVNSIVKEKNFNSILRGLTVYVENNDKNGNLKKIFIYEKDRTIIAETGKVFYDGENTFLELYNGSSQEGKNQNVNFINFSKTIFDFNKYAINNVVVPKFSEIHISSLFKLLKQNSGREKDIREEINTRLIKPFCMLIITIICSFGLYTNNEKFNIKKLKIVLFSSATFFLIINEILINLSAKNFFSTIIYIIFLTTIFFILFINFIFFIKRESLK